MIRGAPAWQVTRAKTSCAKDKSGSTIFGLAEFHGSVPQGYELESSQVERLLADCFLSPISDQGPGLLMPELKIVYKPEVLIYYSGPPIVSSGSENNTIVVNVPEEVEEEELSGGEADQSPTEPATPTETPVADSSSTKVLPQQRRPKITRRRHRRLQKGRRRRASDVPILSIPLKQYLDLMQCTVERLNGRSLEPELDSTIPLDIEAMGDLSSWAALEKYGIDPAYRCELGRPFRRLDSSGGGRAGEDRSAACCRPNEIATRQ